jgi:hydroxyacylglutathione hydrolase
MVYCAHEYTLDNIGFAKLLEPNNMHLLEREKEVKKLLKKGLYSVPSKLENELKINPFLRFDNNNIINAVEHHYNKKITNEVDVFKYTREWKDREYD